jgi:hypothetical protein
MIPYPGDIVFAFNSNKREIVRVEVLLFSVGRVGNGIIITKNIDQRAFRLEYVGRTAEEALKKSLNQTRIKIKKLQDLESYLMGRLIK